MSLLRKCSENRNYTTYCGFYVLPCSPLLDQFAHLLQAGLFPAIELEIGEIGETARHLIATLAMLPLHRFVPAAQGWNGRPAKDRLAIARAFVAISNSIAGNRPACNKGANWSTWPRRVVSLVKHRTHNMLYSSRSHHTFARASPSPEGAPPRLSIFSVSSPRTQA